jgi:hypothetical protein
MSWNGEERRNQKDHILLMLEKAKSIRLQQQVDKLQERLEEVLTELRKRN